MKIYKYLFSCLAILSLTTANQSLKSQTPSLFRSTEDTPDQNLYRDFTFRESIKSVSLHKEGWPLSYPVMELNDAVPLVLTFDELGNTPQTYTYTLTHCDHLWQETRILKSDFMTGIQEEVIRNFAYSINTHQDYIHYRLAIPNEDMQINLAGNYVITVYEDFDHSRPVLSRRFFVVNPRVILEGQARRSDNLENFNTHQEVDFVIRHPGLRLDDPQYNIRVVVMQNQDWSTAITDLKPAFTGVNELIYDYEEENQFAGLSEFHHFETKNLNYITEGIRDIVFERPLNHVYLLPDPVRSTGGYEFDQDINGKYLITYHLDYDPATGADYVMTHFSLPFEAPITGGKVFVYGGLSDWSFSPAFEMAYNMDSRSYELSALLKQGYYNYQYRFVADTGFHDPAFFEGSHFETENDYLIFVYYRDYSRRYEELTGILELNNMKEVNQ